MHRADTADEIVALPIRWRTLALTVAYCLIVVLAVGLGEAIIALLFHGEGHAGLDFDPVPWLVCGLAAGLVAGLINLRRRPRGVRLTATDLEVPRFWRGGTCRLSRAEIDAAASLPRRTLDVLLRRDVIRSRTGSGLSIYRWSYSDHDVRRIEAALGIALNLDRQGA